jgi:hypothetical protein
LHCVFAGYLQRHDGSRRPVEYVANLAKRLRAGGEPGRASTTTVLPA